MKVLLVASEVAPIIKLGGLGDVTGSLPIALEKIGVNVDVVVPYFPIAKFTEKVFKSLELNIPFNEETVKVEVYKTKLPNSNVDSFLLKNDKYFTLGGTNAFANNISETEMFTFFDRAVVELIKQQFNTYDIVHCNDWHAGLITHLLKDELPDSRPHTLFTIHNLLYQGIAGSKLVQEVGIVPGAHPLIDWDIQDGDINLMLQGVTSSDYINTVSPTYAKEILTEEYARDMADVLKAREGRLSGIINGIDYNQLPRNYDVSNWKKEKAIIKENVRKKLGMGLSDKPLYSYISRLDPNQKGTDILYAVIPELLRDGGQFILLGTGDKGWEEKFAQLPEEVSSKYDNVSKGDVSVNIKFDTALANEIYQASDFFIVPSKYEPCGLTQMIAMWYGTLPIVRNTGGLKDSVANGVTGFVFDDYSGESLLEAIRKSFKIYDTRDHDLMVQNAMRTDLSWERSAQEYKKLYERMLEEKPHVQTGSIVSLS